MTVHINRASAPAVPVSICISSAPNSAAGLATVRDTWRGGAGHARHGSAALRPARRGKAWQATRSQARRGPSRASRWGRHGPARCGLVWRGRQIRAGPRTVTPGAARQAWLAMVGAARRVYAGGATRVAVRRGWRGRRAWAWQGVMRFGRARQAMRVGAQLRWVRPGRHGSARRGTEWQGRWG